MVEIKRDFSTKSIIDQIKQAITQLVAYIKS